MELISPADSIVVKRVLNDIRAEFPIIEAFDYEAEIRNIVNKKIWDVISNLECKYEKELDVVLCEMAYARNKNIDLEVDRSLGK